MDEKQSPVASALGSGVAGALFGLAIYKTLLLRIPFADFAAALTAFTVAITVAGLTRYQKSILGTKVTPVWLPAFCGGLAGGGAGVLDVYFRMWHRSALGYLDMLLVGAVAGIVTGCLAESLGENPPEQGD